MPSIYWWGNLLKKKVSPLLPYRAGPHYYYYALTLAFVDSCRRLQLPPIKIRTNPPFDDSTKFLPLPPPVVVGGHKDIYRMGRKEVRRLYVYFSSYRHPWRERKRGGEKKNCTEFHNLRPIHSRQNHTTIFFSRTTVE